MLLYFPKSGEPGVSQGGSSKREVDGALAHAIEDKRGPGRSPRWSRRRWRPWWSKAGLTAVFLLCLGAGVGKRAELRLGRLERGVRERFAEGSGFGGSIDPALLFFYRLQGRSGGMGEAPSIPYRSCYPTGTRMVMGWGRAHAGAAAARRTGGRWRHCPLDNDPIQLATVL